ncbi:hypothetical protein ACP275_08G103200 [Erythranthe tilingii]
MLLENARRDFLCVEGDGFVGLTAELGEELLGDIVNEEEYDVRFAIIDTYISKREPGAFIPAKRIVADGTYTAIRLQITFTPCDINPSYMSGISESYSVKRSYFPPRHGGKFTLYQHAHVIDGRLPKIGLNYGRKFEHKKCWEDICHAILEAHNLVYV